MIMYCRLEQSVPSKHPTSAAAAAAAAGRTVSASLETYRLMPHERRPPELYGESST